MTFIEKIFGLNVNQLETYQMVCRAVLIFFIALIFIRISGIRTLGKQNAFDNLTAVMLGAIMGRAIVAADQPLFGSLVAVLALMLLHRLVSWNTFQSKKLGLLFKGKPFLLMKDGKMNSRNLAKTNITNDDILESLRRDANSSSLDNIKEIYLERSGDLSFVKK